MERRRDHREIWRTAAQHAFAKISQNMNSTGYRVREERYVQTKIKWRRVSAINLVIGTRRSRA